MAQMVRKQIYIQKHQQTQLKRIAEKRGVSEAAVIRQAIDHEISNPVIYAPQHDSSAWDEILRFIEKLRTRSLNGKPIHWDRQEIYQERESRYDR